MIHKLKRDTFIIDIAGRGGEDKFVVIRGIQFFSERPLVTTQSKLRLITLAL